MNCPNGHPALDRDTHCGTCGTRPTPAPELAAGELASGCGHGNPADAAFCGTCGKPTDAPVPGTCPDGHPNPSANTFCGTCGKAIATPAPPVAATTSNRRRSRMIAGAVTAVVVVVGIAAFAAAQSDDAPDDDSSHSGPDNGVIDPNCPSDIAAWIDSAIAGDTFDVDAQDGLGEVGHDIYHAALVLMVDRAQAGASEQNVVDEGLDLVERRCRDAGDTYAGFPPN